VCAIKFRLQRGTKMCVLKRIRFIAKRCAQLISTGCQRSRFYKSGFL